MKIEHRTVPLKVKEVAQDGTFSGYLSVFGNVDSYGDVVERGAFSKTINDRSEDNPVPVLWQHMSDEPIGVYTEMREDDHGLFVKGRLAMGTARGREAHELLSMKAIRGLSIGYQVINEAWEGGVRRLKEIKLWEGSVVTFPANELATVTSVKAAADVTEALQKMTALLADMQTLVEKATGPVSDHPEDDDQEEKGAEPDWSTLMPEIESLKLAVRDAETGDLADQLGAAVRDLMAA